MTSNLSWSLAKETWSELKEIAAKLTANSTVVAEQAEQTLSSGNAARLCY